MKKIKKAIYVCLIILGIMAVINILAWLSTDFSDFYTAHIFPPIMAAFSAVSGIFPFFSWRSDAENSDCTYYNNHTLICNFNDFPKKIKKKNITLLLHNCSCNINLHTHYRNYELLHYVSLHKIFRKIFQLLTA